MDAVQLFGKPLTTYYSSANASLVQTYMNSLDSTQTKGVYLSSSDAFDFDLQVYNRYNKDLKTAFYLKSNNFSVNSYIAFVNTISADSLPLAINQMNQAMLRTITGNSKFSLKVANHPFPLSAKAKEF